MKRLVVILLVAFAGRAHAQKAEAQAAFERGRDLMAKGEIDKACAEFETSMKLDPEKGTLYNLGLCHEKQGKLASAWAEFKELAANDTNAARQKDAARRVAALEPRLTRMKLVVKDQPGLVVTRDGVDVSALVGQPTPVDPGHYTFEANVPGKPPVTITADLKGEGETVAVKIPDAPTGEVTPGPTDEYPTELPLRPLLLPNGMFQIAPSIGLFGDNRTTQTGIDGFVDARAGIGKFELAAGTGAHLHYANAMYNPYRTAIVYGQVAYSIEPMIAALLRYESQQPTGGPGAASNFTGLGATKRLIAKHLAVDARGGFVYFSGKDSCGGKVDEFSLLGDGTLQFAILPALSAQAGAELRLNVGGNATDDRLGLAVSAGVNYAVTHQIDIFTTPYFQVAPSNGFKVLTFGVAWRNR